MPIAFACRKCQKKYRVKEELAGKTAKCGDCQTRMKIPALAAATTAAATAPQKPAPQKPASKRTATKRTDPTHPAVSSSSRTNPSKVASTNQAAAGAKSGFAPQPDLSDFFDEAFTDSGTSNATTAPVYSRNPTTNLCSACGSSLDTSAVLCTSCGFDLRTGKNLKAKKDSKQKKSRARAAAQQTASLGRGTLFCLLGASIGTAVWVGVAIFTGFEHSMIAWGLGGATGLGMAAGHEDDNGTSAGLIAAGISILAIVAAKYFVYENMISEITSELKAEGISLAAAESFAGESLSYYSMMFSPYDALFMGLACFTAYRIGSGRATG